MREKQGKAPHATILSPARGDAASAMESLSDAVATRHRPRPREDWRLGMSASNRHIVFVPGLLCTAELFSAQLVSLGAGGAEVSVGKHTGFASMPEIARAILSAAPPRFALAGLSMGGYIAFEILRQAPARVTRLALLDTNARADRPEQIEQRRKLLALGRSEGARAVQQALLPHLVHPDRLGDAALVETVLRMAEETGQEAFERQQTAIIARQDNRPFLGQIRCPTVIIVGAEDALTPVKVAEEMHAGIAGSRLEVIPHCGHLSTLERPEAVNRILSAWLAG
jgi:pimeloyl-ACP methyl ester carboxylesterase